MAVTSDQENEITDGKLHNKEVNEETPLKAEEKESKPIDEIKKQMSIMDRIKFIKANTTVEPIMACYIIPSTLSSIAIQNLSFEKACRVNLNISDEICHALNLRQTENYTHQEIEVQKLIAGIQAWKSIIQTTIPVLLILFVGAWSDKTGKRKACIMMPIVGEFLSCIGFIFNTYFFDLPVEVAALTESIFPAITGGWFTNFIGVFSYIGDITTEENRTHRVGIVNLFITLGYPIGSALNGVFLKWFGYYGVFCISSTLYMFSLFYGYTYIKDPKLTTSEEKTKQKGGFLRFLIEFFDISLVKETFRVAFGKTESNRRLRVILLLIAVFTIFGPLNGEYMIWYQFTRFRFNWNEVQFGLWSSYATVINLIGTMFSISVFTKYMKLDDTLLALISCTSKIIASFAYAFARNDLEIYLAPLLEILNGTSFIAMRSIMTKLVTGKDIGKVNSLFGLAEAMTPLVYSPLYSTVYRETLDILPGAVFLLGSSLILPAMGIFIWLYFEHKKDTQRAQAAPLQDAENCCLKE